MRGYSSREMLDRYITIDDDDAREAMKRLGEFLGGNFLQSVDQERCQKNRKGLGAIT